MYQQNPNGMQQRFQCFTKNNLDLEVVMWTETIQARRPKVTNC